MRVEFRKTMKNSSDIKHNLEQSNNQNYIQKEIKGICIVLYLKGGLGLI
jgi:hypothetical protein